MQDTTELTNARILVNENVTEIKVMEGQEKAPVRDVLSVLGPDIQQNVFMEASVLFDTIRRREATKSTHTTVLCLGKQTTEQRCP